ncbi:prepilin peptidase [Pseudobutyrivibrio sp.]|uniref:prepilin peptidase n=1 Tax=Pseudobutyrivibrio sp. TaxID=2014367 RepID=UPI001D2593A0|nr:prepilin peptidase [Pseudobutyrivibrio sp.]
MFMTSIIYISIIIASYIVSAYATTDISRLVSDSYQKYFTFDCYCPACNHKLSAADQLPIFSFYINGGKCKYCKSPIPKIDHILEVGIFLFFTFVNTIFKYSFTALLINVVAYEILKVTIILIKRPRKIRFVRSAIVSLFSNVFIFGFLGFFYLLLEL